MINLCPLRDIAASDALTPREWEALGRVAMVIEGTSPHMLQDANSKVNESYRDRRYTHMWGHPDWMVSCKITSLRRSIRLWISKLLDEAGLNSGEFVVIVVPCYESQQPVWTHDDDIPERWSAVLRMNCPQSAAKQAANDTHKPTLSEQHGKSRS